MILAQVTAGQIWPWVLLALALVFYFAPTKIAYDRKNPWRLVVFVVNLVFGWTILGWLIALAMAFRPARPVEDVGSLSRPPAWPSGNANMTLEEFKTLHQNRHPGSSAVLILALALLAAPAVDAGTATLEWDPVVDAVGYRVSWWTDADPEPTTIDVGAVTMFTVPGLPDCTPIRFGVKAVSAEGVESVDFSNDPDGWPRPTVAPAPPVTRGTTVAELLVTGTNFMLGADVEVAAPGVSWASVTVNTCTQIALVDVVIDQTTELGAVDLTVVNPDRIFGVGPGALEIQADDTPPGEVRNLRRRFRRP